MSAPKSIPDDLCAGRVPPSNFDSTTPGSARKRGAGLVLGVFQDHLQGPVGGRGKQHRRRQVEGDAAVGMHGNDSQGRTVVARLNAELLTFDRIGHHPVVEKEVGRVGQHEGDGGIVDALDPEQRTLLAVGHDDEIAQLAKTEQTLGKMHRLLRIVLDLAEAGLDGFHAPSFFVASERLRALMSTRFHWVASLFS